MSRKKPYFSIIMPVYNVEAYLDAAIKSILGQTFRDFELILVDDGSTDSSSRIAARYRDSDRRVVLVSQPNAGLSAARNTGLSHARGTYVYCIDGDDLLDRDTLKQVRGIITRNNEPQVVGFKASPFLDDAYSDSEGKAALRIHTAYFENVGIEDCLYPGSQLYLEMRRRHNFIPNAWLYAIKAEFLRGTGLQFVQGIINEDEVFTRDLFLRAESVYMSSRKFYQYRLRKGSIMQSGVYRHRVLSLVRVAEEIHALYERENIPELEKDALRFYNEAVRFQGEHFPADPELANRLLTSSLFRPNLQAVTPAGQDFEMRVPSPESPRYAGDAYQPLTARIVSSYILEDSIFFDLGAGYGYFSLIAASRVKAKKVVAVEPEPFAFEILSGNARLNALQSLSVQNQPLPDGVNQDAVEFLQSFDDGVSNLFFKINAGGGEAAVLQSLKPWIEQAGPRARLLVEYDPGRTDAGLPQMLSALGFETLVIDEASKVICKVEAGHPLETPEQVPGPQGGADGLRLLCLPKQSPVSVLFFSHSNLLYGAERSLLAFAAELPRLGMVPTVVLPFDGPLKRRLEDIGAVTLNHLYGWWSDGSPVEEAQGQARLAGDLRTLEENLLPVLRRVNPDIIVTNTSVIPWGGVSAFLLDKPHLWYVHELGVPERGIHFFYSREVVAEYIKGGANLVISNSLFTQRGFFGESAPIHAEILYPFSELEQEYRQTEGYFQQADCFKLTCLGTIAQGKGQEDAIRAMQELSAAGRNVELVLAGDPDPEYLKTLTGLIEGTGLENRIHFAGFVKYPHALYEQADAVLACYRDEPFGLVTLEAMRLAKPVIAAASGGTLELIKDGEEGLLYPSGDASQLAERIKRLMDEPKTRKRLGAKAAETARQKFSREASLSNFIRVLRSVTGEANQSSRTFSYWVRELENMVWRTRLAEKEAEKDAQLAEIHSSRGWRLVLWLRKVRLLIATLNSRRARAGQVALSILKKMAGK